MSRHRVVAVVRRVSCPWECRLGGVSRGTALRNRHYSYISPLSPPLPIPSPILTHYIFLAQVTWNTVSPTSHSRHLRGCIGTFETQPLAAGLSSYALHSALQDHRFSPITKGELPGLEVSVTLLTDFETCKGAMDWELGVHGIRISFYAKNRRFVCFFLSFPIPTPPLSLISHSQDLKDKDKNSSERSGIVLLANHTLPSFGACYLPDVAVEQGWDKEETLISLMRKAGWGGKKEKWAEVGDMTVTRFQGAAESVGWEEFKAWKTWVGKR